VDLKVGARSTEASISTPGEEDLFRIVVDKQGSYVVKTTGRTDVKMALYGPDNQTVQIAEDDDRWGSATDHFRQLVKRLTGNPVEIVETDTSQIAGLLRSRKPLWRDVRRDGVVVFGANLDDLAQQLHG